MVSVIQLLTRISSDMQCVETTTSHDQKLIHQSYAHRLPFLDGLRALAILLVMTFHSHGIISRHLFNFGDWAGIDVFFVLSGFLITRLLVFEVDRTETVSLKKFYRRRVLRLLPGFVALAAYLYLFNPYKSTNIGAAIMIAAGCLSDIDIAFQWGHIAGSGLDITWSLSIEEKFYAIWPRLVRSARQQLGIIAGVAILLCFAWKIFAVLNCPWLPRWCVAIDTRIDTIMFGCLCAIALVDRSGWASKWRNLCRTISPIGPLILMLLCILLVGPPPDHIFELCARLRMHCIMLLFDVSVGLLIMCLYLQPQGKVNNVMSSSCVGWIGRISYGLYLWHTVAYLMIAGHIRGYAAEFVGYTLALALGTFSFYFIEKPFLSLKSREKVH